MYKTKIIYFFLFGIMFCVSNISRSQPSRGPFIISPQVQADKKIIFRYLAPSTKQVLLGGSQFGAAQVPMTKDSIGIWSITVGPVKPDIYPYSFVKHTSQQLYKNFSNNF